MVGVQMFRPQVTFVIAANISQAASFYKFAAFNPGDLSHLCDYKRPIVFRCTEVL